MASGTRPCGLCIHTLGLPGVLTFHHPSSPTELRHLSIASGEKPTPAQCRRQEVSICVREETLLAQVGSACPSTAAFAEAAESDPVDTK